jgi:dihydrolipoamide dehydrogenase
MQSNVWTRLPGGILRRVAIIHQGGNIRSMSATHDADLVVIGSGPGGYVAAIKASQLGMKVRE